ncbi:MAG: pilus assembly protein [Desulfobacterales bacterium]|nr:pilus assembly protein [Desulfobacterales bacterium]
MRLFPNFRIAPLKGLVKESRGQSSVEFAVGAPVLIFMIFAILYVNDFYIAKEKTLVSARYGSWKLARDANLSGDVKPDILQHYFEGAEGNIEIQDVSDTNPFNAENANTNITGLLSSGVDSVVEFINKVFTDGGHLRYGIRVTYSGQPKLGPFDLAKIGVDPIHVSSAHYVDGNSWDGDNTDVHEVMGLLWETVKGAFQALNDEDVNEEGGEADLEDAELP